MSGFRFFLIALHLRMPGLAMTLALLALLAALVLPIVYSERQADLAQAEWLAKKGTRK